MLEQVLVKLQRMVQLSWGRWFDKDAFNFAFFKSLWQISLKRTDELVAMESIGV